MSLHGEKHDMNDSQWHKLLEKNSAFSHFVYTIYWPLYYKRFEEAEPWLHKLNLGVTNVLLRITLAEQALNQIRTKIHLRHLAPPSRHWLLSNIRLLAFMQKWRCSGHSWVLALDFDWKIHVNSSSVDRKNIYFSSELLEKGNT